MRIIRNFYYICKWKGSNSVRLKILKLAAPEMTQEILWTRASK